MSLRTDTAVIGLTPDNQDAGGNYLYNLPESLQKWVMDHVEEALQSDHDGMGSALSSEPPEKLQARVWLSMLATMEYLCGCHHMETLTTSWSVIKHDSAKAAQAWLYRTSLGEAQFEPNDLNFWKITETDVLQERIDALGKYGLDPVETELGLGYAMGLFSYMLREEGEYQTQYQLEQEARRWKPLVQVTLWATMMWLLSEYGWEYLLEAGDSGIPRSPIAWQISCYPIEVSEEERAARFGFATTPAQSVVNSDDPNVMAWGQLLFTDQLVNIGDTVRCANEACGVISHCLKRVDIVNPDTGNVDRVHLCSHCRELAWSNGQMADQDAHRPKELGGRGAFADSYDCLRTSVFKPYCEKTKDCKHNQQATHLKHLAEVEREAVHQRVRQLETTGQSAVLDAWRHQVGRLLGG